jgi:hypothetical protein
MELRVCFLPPTSQLIGCATAPLLLPTFCKPPTHLGPSQSSRCGVLRGNEGAIMPALGSVTEDHGPRAAAGGAGGAPVEWWRSSGDHRDPAALAAAHCGSQAATAAHISKGAPEWAWPVLGARQHAAASQLPPAHPAASPDHLLLRASAAAAHAHAQVVYATAPAVYQHHHHRARHCPHTTHQLSTPAQHTAPR